MSEVNICPHIPEYDKALFFKYLMCSLEIEILETTV
jgi:hypothetical protein